MIPSRAARGRPQPAPARLGRAEEARAALGEAERLDPGSAYAAEARRTLDGAAAGPS